MPRRPPVVLALLLATACAGSDPVQVPPVDGLPAAAATECRALVDRLPSQVGDLDRREVRPADDLTAAWGDSPLTLRCGVPAGSPRDEAYTVNGVRWAVHDTGASHTWTTLTRSPGVELVVPDGYENPGELVGALSRVIG